MSIEIDPKEVIEHLKEYGIERISEERLKCFIKDLKKLIKHDEKKHKTEWSCGHYSTQESTPSTRVQNEQRKEKIEECSCQSCYENKFRLNSNMIRTRNEIPDVKLNCNFMTGNHVSSTHCNCVKSKFIKPTTARNCTSSKHCNYCSNHEFARPSTAHNHVSSTHHDCSKSEFVMPSTAHNRLSSTHCNSSKSECTIPACEPPLVLPAHCNNYCYSHECSRPATTQCCYSVSRPPCFNQENSCSQDLKENKRPSFSVESGETNLKKKTQKKLINDPVLLYHKYQSVWKKHKLPGENDHALLRRAIREKMKYKP